MPLAAITCAITPDNAHFAKTRLIAFENTMDGKVLESNYLSEVVELARNRGLALHLDGAQLFNAAPTKAEQMGFPPKPASG